MGHTARPDTGEPGNGLRHPQRAAPATVWFEYFGEGSLERVLRSLLDGHRLSYRAVGDNTLLVSRTPDAWVYFNQEALAGNPRPGGVHRR